MSSKTFKSQEVVPHFVENPSLTLQKCLLLLAPSTNSSSTPSVTVTEGSSPISRVPPAAPLRPESSELQNLLMPRRVCELKQGSAIPSYTLP